MNKLELFKRQNKFTKKLRKDFDFWEKTLTEKRRYNKHSINILLDIEGVILANIEVVDLKKTEGLKKYLPSKILRIFKKESNQNEFVRILKRTKYDCTKLSNR